MKIVPPIQNIPSSPPLVITLEHGCKSEVDDLNLFDYPFPCRFGMNLFHFIKQYLHSVKGPKIEVVIGSL